MDFLKNKKLNLDEFDFVLNKSLWVDTPKFIPIHYKHSDFHGKEYRVVIGYFDKPVIGAVKFIIYSLNPDSFLSPLSLPYDTDIYNLVPIRKKPPEIWLPVVVNNDNGVVHVSSHRPYDSEQGALSYVSDNKLFKTSHAVKVWPKD
jgi:hypothetical protein